MPSALRKVLTVTVVPATAAAIRVTADRERGLPKEKAEIAMPIAATIRMPTVATEVAAPPR
jgi:hypothetical protein